MALINKIREKSGWAVGVIAVGLGLFIVGGDLLGPNSMILGRNQNKVGEIAGETVSYQDFQRQVDELEYNWTANYGRKPSETDMFTIRQQAWELMVVKYAFRKQFDKLGVKVTDQEIIDMVQGNNVSPDIQGIPMFQNEETGAFDKQRVVQFLQSISQAPLENQAQWLAFEQSLPAGRIRVKYDNLMLLSTYVTKAEAAQEYADQNKVAEINYVYVPYSSVNDSLVKVTDDQLKKYMNENKEKYKATESRSIAYVTFPVSATSEDSLYLKQDLLKLVADFTEADNDSTFAAFNAESQDFYAVVNPGQLPLALQSENLEAGKVYGPLVENGSYVLYKLSKVGTGDKFSARASHILFKWSTEADADKAEAKKEAERILKELKAGADFAQLARQYSVDPSSSQGGDLGWFNEETMVEPFSKAVFEMNSKGLVGRVVESQFGYHLILVTEAKTKTEYHFAKIDREIAPSEDTRDKVYRTADMFAASSSSVKEFRENSTRDGLPLLDASKIAKDARRVGILGTARELVRWLYNEASVGKVSEVFEIDNTYVVAVMTEKVAEGELNIESVRNELTLKVKNQLKAQIIKSKLTEGSLDAISTAYGADAKVGGMSDLKISTNTISGVGFAPAAVGAAFGLEAGQKSGKIELDNGIIIVELVSLTPAIEIGDYTTYKQQIEQRVVNRAGFNIAEAIKKDAAIVDERYKFY